MRGFSMDPTLIIMIVFILAIIVVVMLVVRSRTTRRKTEQRGIQAIFCVNCGCQINAFTRFCTKCGTAVQNPAMAHPPSSNASQYNNQPQYNVPPPQAISNSPYGEYPPYYNQPPNNAYPPNGYYPVSGSQTSYASNTAQTNMGFTAVTPYKSSAVKVIIACAVCLAILAGVIVIVSNNGRLTDVFPVENSNSNSPAISVEQMQEDLIDINDRLILNQWQFIHFTSSSVFDDFEITKTLTEGKTVKYYVDIKVSNLYAPNFWYYKSFNGSLLLEYKKYDEGWEFERARVNEYYSGVLAD